MLNNAKMHAKAPSTFSLVLIAFKGDIGISLFVSGKCDLFSGGLECLVSDTHCSKKTDNGDERECSFPPPLLRSIFRAQLPVRRVSGTGTDR